AGTVAANVALVLHVARGARETPVQVVVCAKLAETETPVTLSEEVTELVTTTILGEVTVPTTWVANETLVVDSVTAGPCAKVTTAPRTQITKYCHSTIFAECLISLLRTWCTCGL